MAKRKPKKPDPTIVALSKDEAASIILGYAARGKGQSQEEAEGVVNLLQAMEEQEPLFTGLADFAARKMGLKR